MKNAWAQWEALSESSRAYFYLFLFCFLTRLIGAIFGGVRADDQDKLYFEMAFNFLRGNGLLFVHSDFGRVYSWLPPGMSFLYMVTIWGGHYNELASRFFFVLMSALTILPFFALAKYVLKPAFALLASAVWIFYVPQWFWGSRINPHTYTTNAMILAIYLLFVAWNRKSFVIPFLIGALWTTITLNRGEMALGIFVLAAASLFFGSDRKYSLLTAVLLILGSAAVFAPWVARNYRLHHRFVLIATAYGDNLWKSYNPAYDFSGNDIAYPDELRQRLKNEPNEVGRADILKNDALKFIKNNPLRAVRNAMGNFLNFWRPWLSFDAVPAWQNLMYVVCYIPLMIFFFWGLFQVPYRNPYWMVIVGLIVYKTTIHIPFYIIVRFREVIMPLMALVAMLPLQNKKYHDRSIH